MADWDMNAMLLRQIQFTLAGANWQRSGGKGRKPEPIELPSAKQTAAKPTSAEIVQKLRLLGHAPPPSGEQ